MLQEVILRLPNPKSPNARLIYGQSCRESLETLPDHSVHTVITSPPYWGLRDYGNPPEVWGGDASCSHHFSPEDVCVHCGAWRGQLGFESHYNDFVSHLCDLFDELKRVLRKDGLLWVNMGDTYISDGLCSVDPLAQKDLNWSSDRKTCPNRFFDELPSKSLVCVPWRLALALQDRGWVLRQDIIWAKGISGEVRLGKAMPESVRDRCTKSHEYLFMFAHPKSAGRYYFDQDSLREKYSSFSKPHSMRNPHTSSHRDSDAQDVDRQTLHHEVPKCDLGGANVRSVWHIKTVPYSGSHFACFPPKLPEMCIKASTSEYGVCDQCGSPFERDWEIVEASTRLKKEAYAGTYGNPNFRDGNPYGGSLSRAVRESQPAKRSFKGWKPSCSCVNIQPIPATVMDIFSGSATTGMVALQQGRDYVGLDLNSSYLDLAKSRVLGLDYKTPEKEESTLNDLFFTP